MASHCIMSLCVLTGMFFFFFPTSLSAAAPEKVKLDLYYESLCNGCADFIVNDLQKIFQNGLIDIVHLNVVPYGNAKLDSKGIITCQHGKNECILNMMQACAIYTWPAVNKHYEFVQGFEKAVLEGHHTPWKPINEADDSAAKTFLNCTTTQLGKELGLKYATETENLVPPHTFVPWVVVNGNPLKEKYPEFMTSICEAYKGPKPSACKDIPPTEKLELKQVCPTEEYTFLSVPLKPPTLSTGPVTPMRFKKIKN